MSEQTDVLVIGDTVTSGTHVSTDDVTVRTKNTTGGLNKIRGFSPDVLILADDTVSDTEKQNVIGPMKMMGTEVVSPWSKEDIKAY